MPLNCSIRCGNFVSFHIQEKFASNFLMDFFFISIQDFHSLGKIHLAIRLHWLWNTFQCFALPTLHSPIQSSYQHHVGFSLQWPKTSSTILMRSMKSPKLKLIDWNFGIDYLSSLNFIRKPNSWAYISIRFHSIFYSFPFLKSDWCAIF